MTLTKLTPLAAFFACVVSSYGAPPVNDNFASAIALSSGSSTVDGTSATAQPGEPDHFTFAGSLHATHSVWWKFTPTFSGYVQIDSRGSVFDSVLSVYTGTTFANLHRIAQDDDSGSSTQPKTSLVVIPVVKGTVYHIAVDGLSGDVTGSTTLNITTLRINMPRAYQTALLGALDKEDNGVLTLTTTTSSAVTGSLRLGSHTYGFTGAAAIDGHMVASVNRPGMQPVLLDVNIGSNSQGNVFGPASGFIKVGDTITTIKAYPVALYTAAVPCPRYALNRHYNYAISTSGAVGYGVATVTVSKTGVCTAAGSLGDGSAFVFTAPLLNDSGNVGDDVGTGGTYCYHLPLYVSQGQITGTATFDATHSPTSVGGMMQWYRPAPKAGVAFLPLGINGSEFDTFGNFYSPPGPTHRVDTEFDVANGSCTISIAPLDFLGFSKNDLLLNTSNMFSYGVSNPNLLKLAVSTDTGILTGTVKLVSALPATLTKVSTLKGIVIDYPTFTRQFYGFATSTTGNVPMVVSPNIAP